MYARREKQKPFRPSASYKALEIPLPLFQKPNDIDPDDDNRTKRQSAQPDFSAMVDAETGEPLNYTRAKWTAKEGRLSLTAKTILDMGTGKLDIRNRQSTAVSAQTHSEELIPSSGSHPIVEQFLKDGPLSPMYHVNWNPLSNCVEDPNIAKYGLLTASDLSHDNNNEQSESRTWSSMDEFSLVSSTSSFLYAKSTEKPKIEPETSIHSINRSHQRNNKVSDVEQADRFPLPLELGGSYSAVF